MKLQSFFLTIVFFLFFTGCVSTKNEGIPVAEEKIETPTIIEEPIPELSKEPPTISLLFAGDVMAHNVNYRMTDYNKIWDGIKDVILPADLAFANIEAPIDTTKEASSYPNFNMPIKYVEAAIDAGLDVFSLCNNHTNDQGLDGILQTMKSTQNLTDKYFEKNQKIYFSGLKTGEKASYTYNLIEKNGWKILFLPMTELLNRPAHSDHINFIKPKESDRKKFIEYCKNLRKENPCDLFILSLHTCEIEYDRKVTANQEKFYQELLDAGIDIIWANHAHIIKDRKIIINSENQAGKLIMYANGNTISGQRPNPELSSINPIGERDNTGDGLLYNVTLTKDENNIIHIKKCQPIYITTYINTAYEYIIKKLDQDFVDYLNSVSRKDWAKYIEKRIKINYEYTKDYIEWQ